AAPPARVRTPWCPQRWDLAQSSVTVRSGPKGFQLRQRAALRTTHRLGPSTFARAKQRLERLRGQCSPASRPRVRLRCERQKAAAANWTLYPHNHRADCRRYLWWLPCRRAQVVDGVRVSAKFAFARYNSSSSGRRAMPRCDFRLQKFPTSSQQGRSLALQSAPKRTSELRSSGLSGRANQRAQRIHAGSSLSKASACSSWRLSARWRRRATYMSANMLSQSTT